MKRVNIFQLSSSALFKGDDKPLEVATSKVHQPNQSFHSLKDDNNKQSSTAATPAATTDTTVTTPVVVQPPTSSSEFDHVCNSCAQRFNDRELRNTHYRSPFHRYNLRLRMANMPPVSPADFATMLREAASAPDNSDDSSDDSSSDEDDDERLYKKITKDGQIETRDGTDASGQNYLFYDQQEPLSPKLSFIQRDLKLQFTIWRCILTGASPKDQRVMEDPQLIKQFYDICKTTTSKWAVLLCSGGRFSGAIYTAPTGKAIEHKTLHRYTVRKGQGGSQAKKDQEGGCAGSAGSRLRRYNEKRIREEVLAILKGWQGHLKECFKIFIFAPRGLTRDIILPPDHSGPIAPNDPRVQVLPFPIIRPTYAENQRVSSQLFTVDIDLFEELPITTSIPSAGDQQQQQDEQEQQEIKKRKELQRQVEKTSNITKREKTAYETDPLFEATRKRDIVTVKRLLEEDESYELPIPTNRDSVLTPLYIAVEQKDTKMVEYLVKALPSDLDVCIPSWNFRTALHRAANDGNLELVKILMDAGADPTVEGFRKETVYELANSQKIRDFLREWAGDNLTKWNYQKARIPPLTKEMIAEREENKKKKKKEQKEKEKIKKAQDKINKEEEARRQKIEDEAKTAKLAELKLLDQVTKERQAKDSMLTDRERRALAAEQRFGGTGSSLRRCTHCQMTIMGTPFERLTFNYCSTSCVVAHKKQMETPTSSSK
ncbi:hypothetical protein SAMD00019534_041180 [Acytostelium subglobosum LB1]|uniref:hypothetical protein n=1 Tax=Acytostelium subglobosum LB1 TaxID=1410327 RepID=UPI0006451D97|nr:hypothetical protein SAMD00019534_041180 [Acytostelium subglobosum LB1]GAM20943.1 hypothetical protein SAMD00019534_041180 [Acytostelium subglobosum LB1]|eukprot:XP_012756077.1 hypothetical protein SAMD00019534_041180 [Acytostelium subglobosum LB1]